MNTAQEHFNDDSMTESEWGTSRIVFGLVTGSLTLGLASQDVAENAIAELGLDRVKFTSSVYLGDTVYAYTEALETREAYRDDARIVVFQHWGAKPDGRIVFECRRTVSIKRRQYWRSVP
jgi:itaconyl-CoA hydratase